MSSPTNTGQETNSMGILHKRPLIFARCVGLSGTPWFGVCWSPLLRRRWPMPAMMPGRAIPTVPTTTASKLPGQTTSCVPAFTFSRNPTASVRDTASKRLPQMLLEPLILVTTPASTTACAVACKITQVPTISAQNTASGIPVAIWLIRIAGDA